jgi:hypothetical protein
MIQQVSILIVLDAFPPGGTSVRIALEKIPLERGLFKLLQKK